MKRWIVFDLESVDFVCCEAEQDARRIAERWLNNYRDHRNNGSELENIISVAEIKVTTVKTKRETREEYEARNEEWLWDEDEICDYGLADVKRSPDTAR